MNGWNIDFKSSVAQSVYDTVRNGGHLKGFAAAEEKLNGLKGALESALFDCKWWGEKCESEARHYDYMQKQLQANPQDFSQEHAREVTRKSPRALYEYAAQLKQGADRLYAALDVLGEIARRLRDAREYAHDESGRISEKIEHAIDLMNTYLRVDL